MLPIARPRVLAAMSIASLLVVTITAANTACAAEPLPGTKLLKIAEPLDEVMVSGIDRFALRELDDAPNRRGLLWKRDYSSVPAYLKSVAPNRQRLRTIIGAVDQRMAGTGVNVVAPEGALEGMKSTSQFAYGMARWQVLDGVTAEGLLLMPQGTGKIKALVIALPDADWTPEMFCGLTEGVTPQAQLARRLASNGCVVLVPTLISRSDEFSGNPLVSYTNQPHREFVYRMAFEMGRHVIGYEVQKVLAAVDYFARRNQSTGSDLPIGVVGVGEGGLIALHSAAVDPRIDASLVCGYFQKREGVWEEPIYRNVWSQLTEFGDAEIASLIAPRPLIIEACAVPEIAGPPATRAGRRSGAAPGKIEICTLGMVRSEFDRAKVHYDKLTAGDSLTLVASGEGNSPAGTSQSLSAFLSAMGIDEALQNPAGPPKEDGERKLADSNARQKRQIDELVQFTQNLLRRSDKYRDKFWAKADRSSVENWVRTAKPYRDHVYKELIGKLPKPTMPLNVRTRQVIDEPEYVGYEVVIDVYRDVIASGILLLPKDLKKGERRPVVVCQHGLEGTPMDTITTEGSGYRYYKAFSVELCKRGFITYAPQNPYRGRDRFRTLQRKSNPMKRSLYSYIIPQHERTLEWLASLPNVDKDRIGFYGLSYGGKTAVRVPPFVDGYALSICSADFDEWVLKITSNIDRYSYLFTGEYEIFEWNMGHVANYAELSNLMTPRPFMVERGHDDGVAPDEWVAWEFAKVFRHYDQMGIGDRAEIEFFDGPHTINGKGTFDFLHRHLKWPKRK